MRVLKAILAAILLTALFIAPSIIFPSSVQAQTFPADIQQFWNQLRTGAIAFSTGRVQTSGYLNFGNAVGTNGYGFRDSAGTLQFKDSGGSWSSFPSGGIAPAAATYILKTANASLPNAQTIGALSTGLLFGTTTTGTISSIPCAAVQVLQGGSPPTCASTIQLGALDSNAQLGVGTTPDHPVNIAYNADTLDGLFLTGRFDGSATRPSFGIFAAGAQLYIIENGQSTSGSSRYPTAGTTIENNGLGALNFSQNNAARPSFTWFNATDNNLVMTLAYTSTRSTLTGPTYLSSGSGMAVANVGANSCGTTTATIAGNNNAFVITVGATSGSQCRVAFTVTASTEWDCAANDDTTTVAVRTTPVDTTHADLIGAFTAGDKVTGICFPR